MNNKRTVKSKSGPSPKMAKPSTSQSCSDPTVNWRSSKNTIREGFEHLYNNELFSDLYLIVGEGRQRLKIPAHKLVLSLRSEVFTRMLSEDWSCGECIKGESKDEINRNGSKVEITIKDVEPDAFTAFLKFLYYDHVEFEGKTVMFVLQAAQMYQVFPLVDQCVKFLINGLDTSNVFDLLIQGQFFTVPALVESCLKLIDKKIEKAITLDGFLKLDLDSLCLILERDSLRIGELKLFQAVIRWSESQCKKEKLKVTPENQLSVLSKANKNALYLIRFPLMSLKEFSRRDVSECGLLSALEVNAMLLYFVRSGPGSRKPVPFNKNPRAWQLHSYGLKCAKMSTGGFLTSSAKRKKCAQLDVDDLTSDTTTTSDDLSSSDD